MSEFENGIAWMIAGGRRADREPAGAQRRSLVAWFRSALGRLRPGAPQALTPGVR